MRQFFFQETFFQWQHLCKLDVNFNESKQPYFTAGIYFLYWKLAVVWNFTLVKMTEVKFKVEWKSLQLNSYEHFQRADNEANWD